MPDNPCLNCGKPWEAHGLDNPCALYVPTKPGHLQEALSQRTRECLELVFQAAYSLNPREKELIRQHVATRWPECFKDKPK